MNKMNNAARGVSEEKNTPRLACPLTKSEGLVDDKDLDTVPLSSSSDRNRHRVGSGAGVGVVAR